MSFNIHADYNGKITKSDLRKVWLRSIPMEHSWNYERMMHSGYCFAILPILKKLYPNKEDYINCLLYTSSDLSEEWLDFIVDCRSGLEHKYDIVEGPMADDTIWDYIEDFIEGNISREAFWVLVKFKYPTHQVVFCLSLIHILIALVLHLVS